ncbi:MAG TPA: Ig-like domain-containing protein, partial [Solirubrobacteraceae bacterium]|nr:Ig-like domain-containing protein [Solirubrobacteraceae bacterium]
MLRAHRLAAVRICLLIASFALLSATSALASSSHPSHTVSASRVHDASHVVLASHGRPKGRTSSSSRRARCVVIATRASKHHKAAKSCAANKPKATGTQPSVAGADRPAPTSAVSVGAQIPVLGGPLPTEALEVPGLELGPPAKVPAEASLTEGEPTTTALSSSLDPSTVGQAVSYAATVDPMAATGSVTFEDAGTAISGCADQTVTSGVATCSLSGYIAASTHSITATYSGDSNYIGSTSSLLTQVVSRARTSTTLTSSVNPSMVGQHLTYTATVNPAAGAGTVSFDQAGTPIPGCTAQSVSSGTATCTLSGYATAGEHAIMATYSGDGNYLTSASSSSKQVVDKTGTTKAAMTLSSSLNPSTVGEAVTYTATLNTTAATGTVEFRQAEVTITGCAAQPISAGSAQCTVVNPSSGWRSITAVYSGDNTYATTSSGLGQSVTKKAATMTLSSSLNPSTVGEAVTYTATLNTTAATGTVEFRQAEVTITGCAAQPISAGSAQCTVVNPSSGWRSITAVYSGDS